MMDMPTTVKKYIGAESLRSFPVDDLLETPALFGLDIKIGIQKSWKDTFSSQDRR